MNTENNFERRTREAYECRYDVSRRRRYSVVDPYVPASNGYSRQCLECPHCYAHFEVYIRSFSANGKKCPDCGAKHVRDGMYADPVRNADRSQSSE